MSRATLPLLSLLFACRSITDGVQAKETNRQQKFDDSCSLFLAETVDDRGAVTMGVFTSKPLTAGQPVGFPDLVVPLVDIPLHNSPTHEDEQDFWWVWDDLVWNPIDVGGAHEGMDVKSAALGLGSLTRGNTEKSNVIMVQSLFDNAGLDRTQDPGAGAISYYPGAFVAATDDIEAGSEIFFHHGYHWYLNPHDQERAILDSLPADDHRVKEFWSRYHELGQKREDSLTSELRTQLWGIIGGSSLNGKAQHLLSTLWNDGIKKHEATSGKRSPAWLAKHGICIDNIRQGPSDIPQAGRGAFANRPLPAGTVIAPAPVVHVVDKKALNMYAPSVDENFMYTMSDEVINKQLLINYCFGHSESTKLLCPIGSGTAFVNHSPTPNAAIRWSTHESSALHKEEWLNMTVEEMGKNLNVGLMIEYYALRDISADEEITINYGLDWEKAWEAHVNEWQPTFSRIEYVSAIEMNTDPAKLTLLTVEEQDQTPYPPSIITSCFYEHVDEDGYRDDSGVFADPTEFDVIVKKWKPFEENTIDFLFLRPCLILAREEVTDEEEGEDKVVSFQYTVQILNSDGIHDAQKVPDYEVLVVEGFPRKFITFTDFSYSTDMHLKSTFRHEMSMPDGLFPNAWRNLMQ